MGFSYKPEDASNAWPDGDYDAEISTVEETVSKNSGADMLKVGVKIHHPDGREQTLFDYITAKAVFKLKQIADAIGKGAEFKAGTLDHFSIRGRRMTVTLETEESSEFGDRNKVKKYAGSKNAIVGRAAGESMVKALRERSKANAAAVGNPLGDDEFKADDIPF